MPIVTVGEKIKQLRKKRGITQAELAQRAVIHPVTIRKYETSSMKPLLPQINKIANALNVSMFELTEKSKEDATKVSLGNLMLDFKNNPQTVVETLKNDRDAMDNLVNMISLCSIEQELSENHTFDDVVSLHNFYKDIPYKDGYEISTITDFAVKAAKDNAMSIDDLVNLKDKIFMSAFLENDTTIISNYLETTYPSDVVGDISSTDIDEKKTSVLQALNDTKSDKSKINDSIQSGSKTQHSSVVLERGN